MRISDWSSDVCSSDLVAAPRISWPSSVPSDPKDSAPTIRQSRPVPNNAVMKPGLITVTLIEFIAATPCSDGIRPSPAMTKFEKRSEEHTSELQSLMSNSYAVFCLKTKNKRKSKTQKTRRKKPK